MRKIAVLYLARIAEGLAKFEKFAKSYQQYNAGQDHDLIIIYKGDFKQGQKAGAEHIFKDIPHTSFTVSDDIGFDIHSYIYVADKVKHEYICAFNTHVQINSENWLKKLYAPFKDPKVGIVGTTASYESIYTSQRLLQHVIWLNTYKEDIITRKIQIHFGELINLIQKDEVVKNFHTAFVDFLLKFKITKMVTGVFVHAFSLMWKFVSQIHRRYFNSKASNTAFSRFLKKHVYKYYKFLKAVSIAYSDSYIKYTLELKEEFEAHWLNITTNYGIRFVKDFPPFPNPHIRSNGFIIKREFLLDYKDIEKTKMACCEFESGRTGIMFNLLKKKLIPILVGADGVGYPMEKWVKSNTFRLGEQKNLLIKDNQTENFMDLKKEGRAIHRYMSWGEYSSAPPEVISSLEHKFSKRTPLLPSMEPPKISVIIPTHNRLHFLKEIIFSVQQQHYLNWEIVVFDNASTEPIKEYLKSLDDKRIRYESSKEFLPVTDSWNRAIEYATGTYLIFLGNDDGIVPHYFEKVKDLVLRYNEPDFIYSSIYTFAHPGVFPHCREGYLNRVTNGFFFEDQENPFLLSSSKARKAWTSSVNFERLFGFGLQPFTFKRSFLEKIRFEGKIFHSPYPDYYLANIAMAYGETILICPEPLAIQGISTESFGYTLFNNLEKKGAQILNTNISKDPLFSTYKKYLLPCDDYNTSHILTMGHVAKNAPEKVSVGLGVKRYRYHIISNIAKQKPGRQFWKSDAGCKLWKSLTISEKLSYSFYRGGNFKLLKKVSKIIGKTLSDTEYFASQKTLSQGDFVSLRDVFERLATERTS